MNSDDKIKDWNTPEIKEALEMVKIMLRDYSSSDAIGGVYANVANYFLQEKAAIMPNGAWMIPDFSDTEKAGEGFACLLYTSTLRRRARQPRLNLA